MHDLRDGQCLDCEKSHCGCWLQSMEAGGALEVQEWGSSTEGCMGFTGQSLGKEFGFIPKCSRETLDGKVSDLLFGDWSCGSK